MYNNRYAIQSYRPMHESVEVIVRGECTGIRDLETGRVFTEKLKLPEPHMKGDATAVIPEPTEYAFPVVIGAGRLMFFEVI